MFRGRQAATQAEDGFSPEFTASWRGTQVPGRRTGGHWEQGQDVMACAASPVKSWLCGVKVVLW